MNTEFKSKLKCFVYYAAKSILISLNLILLVFKLPRDISWKMSSLFYFFFFFFFGEVFAAVRLLYISYCNK